MTVNVDAGQSNKSNKSKICLQNSTLCKVCYNEDKNIQIIFSQLIVEMMCIKHWFIAYGRLTKEQSDENNYSCFTLLKMCQKAVIPRVTHNYN